MTDAIDTVLFDLDDTLCSYRRPGEAVLDAAFETAGVSPLFAAADYYGVYDEYLAESTSIHDLRERCFGDLAVEAGHDRAAGHAVAEAYALERDQGGVALIDGAREALDALAAEYRLGLVTNGAPEMQREKLAAAALEDDFETVVCAGYDAPAKPAPDPFDAALEALDSTAERAVHVGNSPSTDVAGAQAAGVRAAWIPDGDAPERPDPTPDYTLESLADLTTPPWIRVKRRDGRTASSEF